MKWTRRASAKDSTRSRRRSSLQVEPLEGRALLATTAASLNQMLVGAAQLAKGASPNSVGLRIATSTEAATHFVTFTYHTYLGRAPHRGGLNFWVGQLRSGHTPDQVVASIAGSTEYFAKAGGTNQGFVTSLYRDVLGRAPDARGNRSWLNALARGVSRETVALGFVASRERAVQEVTINHINAAAIAAPTSPTATSPTATSPTATSPTTATPVSTTSRTTALSRLEALYLASITERRLAGTIAHIGFNIL